MMTPLDVVVDSVLKLLPPLLILSVLVTVVNGLVRVKSVDDEWEDIEELLEEPRPYRPEIRRLE